MRSTTQRVAMVFGVVFLLVGILGFLTDNGMDMNADPETSGKVLGLFPVNLLHNVVHLLFGVWGLVAARSFAASRTYGRVGAAVYALLVVLAFVSPDGFGFVPIGGNAIWLHAVLALGFAYIGFAGTDATTAAQRV